jgi:hypothetical protein
MTIVSSKLDNDERKATLYVRMCIYTRLVMSFSYAMVNYIIMAPIYFNLVVSAGYICIVGQTHTNDIFFPQLTLIRLLRYRIPNHYTPQQVHHQRVCLREEPPRSDALHIQSMHGPSSNHTFKKKLLFIIWPCIRNHHGIRETTP